jgi:heme-degrading monooxygenase HmoA
MQLCKQLIFGVKKIVESEFRDERSGRNVVNRRFFHAGQNIPFEEAVQRGIAMLSGGAKGFQGCKVNRGIESPERYILQVFWDTLEDHTVGFRQGPLYPEWVAIVGPFAAAPPTVEHFELGAGY